ncbi:MAG: hypothetical protein R6W48_12135 [Gaiellaceae bacterium]
MARLSQAIAEGDRISILVEVHDASTAERAERQGADGLVAGRGATEVRASSNLPLLHRGGTVDASGAAADAIIVSVDSSAWHESEAFGLEAVVRVSRTDALERALDLLDPEILLLTVDQESDDDPLEALLALLHDVPAGKLAIAELPDATAEDVAELERAGVDAVLVATTEIASLVPDGPPDV